MNCFVLNGFFFLVRETIKIFQRKIKTENGISMNGNMPKITRGREVENKYKKYFSTDTNYLRIM